MLAALLKCQVIHSFSVTGDGGCRWRKATRWRYRRLERDHRMARVTVEDCVDSTVLRTSLAYATNTFMRDPYSRRLTISFFSSAIALAGFSPFGHAFVQFKIVWQR